jgi:prepilin signal peptidase PulO-like enzyme (type II secretory pathway)
LHSGPIANVIEVTRTVMTVAAPGMPPGYWWVTASVVAILAMAATIDAFTTVVPDLLIFLGMVAVAGTQIMFGPLHDALRHLLLGAEAAVLIWAINFVWGLIYGYDALGMGDAKWTALAVTCFGVIAGCFAWGVGAVLAVIWIGFARLFRYKITRVTFAPFLFIGLSIGLWCIRFIDRAESF